MAVYEQQLAPYTTFGVQAEAKGIMPFHRFEQLLEWMQQHQKQRSDFLILGGGSNVLFAGKVDAFVWVNQTKGIRLLQDFGQELMLEVESGEPWHALVVACMRQGWYGLENLALIPGTVGAAPIQNIGAYGVELAELLDSVYVYDFHQKEYVWLSVEECDFGYRDSLFKRLKDRFFIQRIRLKLHRNTKKFECSYKALSEYFKAHPQLQPSPKTIFKAVVEIRSSKLPDPNELGNAGSFFKNPVVDQAQFDALKAEYPDIPSFAATGGIKVPAAWLIEQSGLKGAREGDCGTYEKQPLVLVNYGRATGQELWAFAQSVQQKVHQQFGILLQPEVNILGAHAPLKAAEL